MQVLLLFHLSHPPLSWEWGGAQCQREQPRYTAPPNTHICAHVHAHTHTKHTHTLLLGRSGPLDTDYAQAIPKTEFKPQSWWIFVDIFIWAHMKLIFFKNCFS